MTYRERREARLAKRQEWAEKRAQKAQQAYDKAMKLAAMIPMGQPILVGHHSEKHARRHAAQIDGGMRQAGEHADKAKDHNAAASTIEHQLATSIYSDDPDAVEALTAKVAKLEADRETMKRVNAAHKAFLRDPASLDASDLPPAIKAKITAYVPAYSWEPHPFAPYQLTNLGAEIRRAKKRIEEVRMRTERAQAAADAPGGVTIEGADFIAVTFAEKPGRDTLEALKAAGFRWSGGSWVGYRSKLPEGIAP